MTGDFVRAENLSVTLGGKTVLSRVNLGIKRGEFVTLIGPNGSGKTTLVKCLLGLIKPSAGGAGINTRRTGYIPQSYTETRGFPATAGELIKSAGISAGIKGNDVIMSLEEIMAELKISHAVNKCFSSLSGGEKQKTILAMALIKKPEVLILDEPNLNLDPHAYAGFLKLADFIHKKHKITVIFVTHMVFKMPVSPARVMVLKKGTLCYDGKAAPLFGRKNAMEEIYG